MATKECGRKDVIIHEFKKNRIFALFDYSYCQHRNVILFNKPIIKVIYV
jgi:hypothetical protein